MNLVYNEDVIEMFLFVIGCDWMKMERYHIYKLGKFSSNNYVINTS